MAVVSTACGYKLTHGIHALQQVWPHYRNRLIGYGSKGSDAHFPQIRNRGKRLQDLELVDFQVAAETLAADDDLLPTIGESRNFADPKHLPKKKGATYMRVMDEQTSMCIPTIMHRYGSFRPNETNSPIYCTLVNRKLIGEVDERLRYRVRFQQLPPNRVCTFFTVQEPTRVGG